MDFVEIFARFYALGFGLVVGGGALAIVIWRDSWRWRQLAEAYESAAEPEGPRKRFSTVILHGRGVAYNSYHSMVTLHVDRKGIWLLFRPFLLNIPIFKPLYIPFADLQATPQSWMLIHRTVELETGKTPGLKIVVWQRTADWIDEQSGGRLGLFSRQASRMAASWPN
ncbi:MULTISPECIES: hypothetical protein [unclassified Hyphomonas]|jgi:hypothetical protein|uniref:hypothetical protein n=1 Tax=unclassified Hyphomonas TaxID=2630699 RepID=UPI0004589E93|nr:MULTISPECIES: hypothetical protein [unclassified Hyphomonas]KCZ49616.1 hypothetical protein HY17_00550 [Hyphomonas sp. CY54-11-8]